MKDGPANECKHKGAAREPKPVMRSSTDDGGGVNILHLISAVAVNVMIGVLYGWSLVIAPLEEFLSVSRGTLSFVPALGLACFTAGVFVHDGIVRRVRLPVLSFGVMLMAGAGHLLFWFVPSYFGLLFGYGVVYGFAAGIGYGLALALARGAPPPIRGWALGLTVAAFAASGMIVSAAGAVLGAPRNVLGFFGAIGIAFCLCAVILALLLRRSGVLSIEADHQSAGPIDVRPVQFLLLAGGFFALCYLGLMGVSHGVAILSEQNVVPALSSLTPFVLNFGYILGAVLGGAVAARVPERIVVSAFLLPSMLSVLAISAPVPASAKLLSFLVIGLGFGSTVPVFVVVLTVRYGADKAGILFGRLNIGYGMAGFLAPAASGWLHDLSGSYEIPLWLAACLGSLGLLANFAGTHPRTQVPTRPVRERK